MIRDNYLDMNKIIQDKKVLKLFRVVESHGGALRFVGGAVRDALAGLKGFDLDLATDLSPDELVEACSENGLRTVPIGIKFGTVGVIINDKVLEVTSLRRDVKTDGRHAVVEFTTDWEADASRRDLTINAVYADEKGNVFDYYNGIEDLEQGNIRFIGNPNHRIKEDYLRILRFFRFYSLFGKGPIDDKALKACVENRDGLKTLSIERIRDEFSKILLTPNVGKTLKIMFDNEILGFLLAPSENFQQLDFLIKLVDDENIPHAAMRRLFVLYQPDEELAENLAARLHLTRKQRESFVRWAAVKVPGEAFLDTDSRLKLIYKYGKEFCRDKMLLQSALEMKNIPNLHARLQEIEDAVVPIFSIRGKDIIAAGISDNRKIGATLDNLEQLWLESNFRLTREELLNKVSEINQKATA